MNIRRNAERVADLMKQWKTPVPLPLTEVLRWRNVGRATANELIKMGLVAHDLDGFLSIRTRNALANFNLETRDQIKIAIEEQRLKPGRPRNFGHKSYKEVCAWLGLPEPKGPLPRLCPHCGKPISRDAK